MLLVRSLRWNLAGLVRFSGRDSRALFWPWVAFLLAAGFILSAAAAIPTFTSTFNRMQRFAAEHPNQATVVTTSTSYQISIQGDHPELMPSFEAVGHAVLAAAIVFVLLLAAAVVRRLHDTDRRGWWGAIPLAFLGFGLWAVPHLSASFRHAAMTHMPPDMRLFPLLFINNIFYLGTLGVLVVLLAGRGTDGPNRFGSAPDGR